MKTALSVIAAIVFALVMPANAADELRFASVDVYLDGGEPVAAWQFELSDKRRSMKVVGVENGDSAAYPRAPYYDREAVRLGTADRIIVADYSVADASELPTGRTRIATVHVVLSGSDDADLEIKLITAVRSDGTAIDAALGLEFATGSTQ